MENFEEILIINLSISIAKLEAFLILLDVEDHGVDIELSIFDVTVEVQNNPLLQTVIRTHIRNLKKQIKHIKEKNGL